MQCPNCPTCTHNCCQGMDTSTIDVSTWCQMLNITQEQFDAMVIERDKLPAVDACIMLRLVDGWLQCFPQHMYGYEHKPKGCQDWVCQLPNPPE